VEPSVNLASTRARSKGQGRTCAHRTDDGRRAAVLHRLRRGHRSGRILEDHLLPSPFTPTSVSPGLERPRVRTRTNTSIASSRGKKRRGAHRLARLYRARLLRTLPHTHPHACTGARLRQHAGRAPRTGATAGAGAGGRGRARLAELVERQTSRSLVPAQGEQTLSLSLSLSLVVPLPLLGRRPLLEPPPPPPPPAPREYRVSFFLSSFMSSRGLFNLFTKVLWISLPPARPSARPAPDFSAVGVDGRWQRPPKVVRKNSMISCARGAKTLASLSASLLMK
jgi:hypothetical protein